MYKEFDKNIKSEIILLTNLKNISEDSFIEYYDTWDMEWKKERENPNKSKGEIRAEIKEEIKD